MRPLLHILTLLIFTCCLAPAQTEQKRQVLAQNDVVDVRVYREDELNSRLRIARDGSIVFPLIGSVKLAGKTPEEAAATIRQLLARDYLVNPQVTVTVAEYDRRRFTVLGQVQKPGTYQMPDRESITLLEAIGYAGGYTRIADPGKVTVKRRDDGKEAVFELNAKSMATGREANAFVVRAGDIIHVKESLF